MLVPCKVEIKVGNSWATEEGELKNASVSFTPSKEGVRVEAEYKVSTTDGFALFPVGSVQGKGASLKEAINSFLEDLESQGGKVIEWVEL